MRTTLTILCLFGTLCAAQAQDCTAIKDDKDRLACFDAASKPAVTSAPVAVAATPQSRDGYANGLRRAMLSGGNDISVWSHEQRSKTDTGADHLKRYPRLLFWGYFNAASVYQIMVQGEVLDGARRRGFSGVEFVSKGDGRWAFDITGVNPRPCDKISHLCL